MSIIGSNILAGAAGQGGGYTIERSLRLRSSASAYLSRTPASAGNRKTWTWSAWVKRGTLGSLQLVFDASSSSTSQYRFGFNTTDTFTFYGYVGATNVNLASSAVYRDISAWYHLVVAMDTTQATSSNRVKVYINGEQVTSFSTAIYPALNHDTNINNNIAHSIGRRTYDNLYQFDGYLTEVNFIDGQALTPSDFGNYNEDTGVWQPAKYIGSYGTNGFYLPFSDNTTTTTLAADASGNGNDWTPNNISLTSGATYDSMTDTPTLTSEDAGNFAVLNPLDKGADFATSNGNLQANSSASSVGKIRATMAMTSGKWYWESLIDLTGTAHAVGISKSSSNLNTYLGADIGDYAYWRNGSKANNSSSTAYGASFASGDVIGVAYDADAGDLTFYKNGVSQGVAYTGISGEFLPSLGDIAGADDTQYHANFGQRPFAYTPPTGFKALHTGNLPDSAIVDGSQYFNAVTYTGNGSTQSITGVGFQPDFVWVKGRNNVGNHLLADAVRGALKSLATNLTNAETDPDTNGLTSFDTDGFSAGSATRINGSSNTYAAWNWKANGAGVSNTDGSITSTVSANPTSGFSIVTYTGNGSISPYPTVGHGLGVAPQLIFTKARSTTSNWVAYTTVIDGSLDFLYLNTTAAKANSGLPTLPTSSVFQVGGPDNNSSGQTHVAYCFSEVEGYSKFGSYTGNGSADGPFVFTNFRPAFVMIKRTDSTSNWSLQDVTRDPYNSMQNYLEANTSDAEATNIGYAVDSLSNGFKIRNSSGTWNASGGTYIYMAFAETGFANALAR